ncbi:MAG TPA: hypothetical protein VFI33_03565 [Puia sp.]|nr:hypothetical protein [Puia sp.]
MMELPKDILSKIDELFPKMEDHEIVMNLVDQIRHYSVNVGFPQLIRSILSLSAGKLSIIRKIIDSDFYGDPRDVIMRAEEKLGNPGHYFVPAFEEIDRYKK